MQLCALGTALAYGWLVNVAKASLMLKLVSESHPFKLTIVRKGRRV